MFTRKHYKAIAGIVKLAHNDDDTISTPVLLNGISKMFENDNPRFDRSKFIKACK